MKPKSPFYQTFDQLPETLPIYTFNNALLPGGEMPLELSDERDLALFLAAVKSDQLIGIVQKKPGTEESYSIGCAGRIRQYRERNDGRLNVMLTGVCRFKIVEQDKDSGFSKIDWTDYAQDYDVQSVDDNQIAFFMETLKDYFQRHNMQTDWKLLEGRDIEDVINNLVLVINLDTNAKQALLESPTVLERLELFTEMLGGKQSPIITTEQTNTKLN